MYRVLVVDDEVFIADSLAFLLENLREPEFEVKKAYSAPEAIDFITREAFHIVLTDIEMPGKSGLELLQEIHVKWPSCQAVLLTGHDNFSYAKQAMQYNVVRYVLKNEGDQVLLEAMEECIRRIKKEQLTTDYVRGANVAYDYAAKRGRRELLWRRMRLCQTSEAFAYATQWKEAKLCLNPDKEVMLLAGCTKETITEDSFDILHAIVRSKIGHAVLSEGLVTGEKLCIWLLQPADQNNPRHALAAIKGLMEAVQETVRASAAIHVTFLLDEEEVPWSQVPEHFEKLEDIARNRLEVHKGLALVGLGFFEAQNKEPGEVVQTAFVGHILRHIQEHLSGDLSLTALSEMVYLNPSYLSRRFKEVTGMNLKDTILKFRMEESCRLLSGTTNRIKNIAAQVGFESAAHFSRIFKQETGLTPQEYRDKEIW